jgi:hypothetical protein
VGTNFGARNSVSIRSRPRQCDCASAAAAADPAAVEIAVDMSASFRLGEQAVEIGGVLQEAAIPAQRERRRWKRAEELPVVEREEDGHDDGQQEE